MASSTREGAGFGPPSLNSLAEQIRAEIEGIKEDDRSSLARAIRAGELLIEAKAQVERGKWLPWLEKNFDLHRTTARDYMRLAANGVSSLHFGSINEALAALPKKSRIKTANPSSNRARSQSTGASTRRPWKNEDVIAWAVKRVENGATVDDLVRDSAAGAGDWPLPGKGLGQNAAEKCKAIAEDRQEHRDRDARAQDPPKKKGPTQGGKRRRQVWNEIRKDGATQLREMQVKVAEAMMALEHYVLPDDIGLSEEEQDDITSLFNDLTNLQRWLDHATAITVAVMDEVSRQRTIKKLQDLAQHPSASEGERLNALKGIERIQAAQRARRLAK